VLLQNGDKHSGSRDRWTYTRKNERNGNKSDRTLYCILFLFGRYFFSSSSSNFFFLVGPADAFPNVWYPNVITRINKSAEQLTVRNSLSHHLYFRCLFLHIF
jgi:hypothetical protein